MNKKQNDFQVGDLFDSGAAILYICEIMDMPSMDTTSYTDHGKPIFRHLRLKYMSGRPIGKMVWASQDEVITLLKEGTYKYYPVAK